MTTHPLPQSSRRAFAAAALVATFAAIAPVAVPQARADRFDDAEWFGGRGAVYVASNATAGNHILVYARDSRGRLQFLGQHATGGSGSGGGLGNQGGLAFSDDGRWLLAVNAGSSEISVFSVGERTLRLVERVPSGGQRPVSVTAANGLVYVLNAGGAVGGSDNITGFKLGQNGRLFPLANSTRPLSAANTGPAQISFNADGDVLAVTEKATQTILTFTINDDGMPAARRAFTSSSPTPFGFAFGRHDHLIVSEAVGGAADASVVSVYDLGGDGNVTVLDPSVPTTESAACWVVITRNGRFAYVSNTGSDTLTGYAVNRDGTLEILDADGITATTGDGPIDIALTRGSRFLYSLNGGDGTISGFEAKADGRLVPLIGVSGVPAGANGLLAR